MINNVPKAINNLTRNVVMNHPNSYNCQLFRKVVKRIDTGVMGGNPTMGGLGVMSTDDEHDVEWVFLGNGFSLQSSDGFNDSIMMDQADANNGSSNEMRFLIEPETKGEFTVGIQDVFYLLLNIDEFGDPTIRLAYQVIAVETINNISPYSLRYICNRRDDIHIGM